jgi:excisionase family DNA binding protein
MELQLVVCPVNPRGMSRKQAAAYVGVSPNTFDRMVKDGTMPSPGRYRRRHLWDRVEIDASFDRLTGRPKSNDWDDIL